MVETAEERKRINYMEDGVEKEKVKCLQLFLFMEKLTLSPHS
jgi:hypothetical protein